MGFAAAEAEIAVEVAAFNGRESSPMKSTIAKKTRPATPFMFGNISLLPFDGFFGSGTPVTLLRIFYATNPQTAHEVDS